MNIRHAHSGPHTAVHGGFTPRSPLGPHDKLEKEAQKWVAQTFFGAMLKQMHEGAFHSKLMDGGRGGQAFPALDDPRRAEPMARVAAQQEASRLRLAGLDARRRAVTTQLARLARVQPPLENLTLRRLAELHPQRKDALLRLRGELREAVEAVAARARIAG